MSYIIHYAGVLRNRFEIINNDIRRLANGEHKKLKRNVTIFSGTRKIGDTVCTEPIARYILEHSKDTNFNIVTNHPCVFGHLSDKADVMKYEEYNPHPDMPVFSVMTCKPDTDPNRKSLNPDRMHVIDYMSIACMNRILMPHEKVIHLEVTNRGVSQVMDQIQGDFVLIHPGKSWPSKTFPPKFWNKIISGLSGKKKVAVIGRNNFYETGVVDVDIPFNVIDLRDLLDLEGLIAAVSMCKALVTNDSGPLHIAGAFPDVKIVLIPSCKHPMHILPWRRPAHGESGVVSQCHNAVTMYKKLIQTEKYLDVTDLQNYSLSEVDNIEDYLPDPLDVVREATNF
jgi:ADP-heptose:LPS heptosyltransferase